MLLPVPCAVCASARVLVCVCVCARALVMVCVCVCQAHRSFARRHFFVRECVENFQIEVPYVNTADNLVDFLARVQPPKTCFAMRDAIMNVHVNVPRSESSTDPVVRSTGGTCNGREPEQPREASGVGRRPGGRSGPSEDHHHHWRDRRPPPAGVLGKDLRESCCGCTFSFQSWTGTIVCSA